MEPIVTVSYPVSLERDEYIQSQQVLVKALRGRTISASRAASVILIALCVLSLVVEFVRTGNVDINMLTIFLMMIVAEGLVFFALPRQLRARHGAAYDTALFAGYSFDGIVTVEQDSVSKRTAAETTVLPYEKCAAFVETAQCMIFQATEGKSLVIPARCLTEEAATLTRNAAVACIPAGRRMHIARLVPGREEPMPQPDLSPEPDAATLCSVRVVYTAHELAEEMADIAWQRYGQSLPNKVLTCVLFSSVAYLWLALPPFPCFLLGMLITLVYTVIGSHLRARSMIAKTEGDACRLSVELTDRYVSVCGNREVTQTLHLPWNRVTRAVERPSRVEFFLEKARLLSIPKRCIDNMDEFRNIVDEHMTKKAGDAGV